MWWNRITHTHRLYQHKFLGFHKVLQFCKVWPWRRLGESYMGLLCTNFCLVATFYVFVITQNKKIKRVKKNKKGSKRKKKKQLGLTIDSSKTWRVTGKIQRQGHSTRKYQRYSRASWQPETVWIVNGKFTLWTEKEKDHWRNGKKRNAAQRERRHGEILAAELGGRLLGQEGGGKGLHVAAGIS